MTSITGAQGDLTFVYKHDAGAALPKQVAVAVAHASGAYQNTRAELEAGELRALSRVADGGSNDGACFQLTETLDRGLYHFVFCVDDTFICSSQHSTTMLANGQLVNYASVPVGNKRITFTPDSFLSDQTPLLGGSEEESSCWSQCCSCFGCCGSKNDNGYD